MQDSDLENLRRLAKEGAAWKDRYMREVEGLNNEGDPIGGDPPSGMRHDVERLQAEVEKLRAENERLKFAMTVPAYCEDHQEWAGMDGAIAFHLIERHGENWAHCGQLMDAWRNANPPGLALYGWLEAESSCNGAKPENMVGNASLIHSTRMHLSIHAPQKAVTTNPLFPVFIGPQRS